MNGQKVGNQIARKYLIGTQELRRTISGDWGREQVVHLTLMVNIYIVGIVSRTKPNSSSRMVCFILWRKQLTRRTLNR